MRTHQRELPAGSSLEEVFAKPDPEAEPEISEGTTMVDGVPAYERVYGRFGGEPLRRIRKVWLAKGGTIYIISCW